MKTKMQSIFIVFLFPLFINTTAIAGEWRFPVHINYVDGLGKVFDLYKSNLEYKGYTLTTEFVMPVGASFNPYFQLDIGLRFGTGFGPFYLVMIENYTYFGVPLNIHAGYTLLPNSSFSPYLKGGIMYHLATGDYLHSSSPGFFAAAGVIFLNDKKVNFGVEILSDLSKLEFDWYNYERVLYGSENEARYKTIQPGKLLIGIFIQF